MELLKSQKNELYEMIVANKFAPSQFEFVIVSNPHHGAQWATRLIHATSNFYFEFQTANDSHYCEFSPGVETMKQTEFPGSWRLQMNIF